MSGNSFGQVFKITTCGESHGDAVAVIVDGCPAALEITEAEIQLELDRRRPGQSTITTPRQEKDMVHILSGVFNGKTTGTPILLLVYNEDARSKDYDELKYLFRPGHADFTYFMKYGTRDYSGSGRASARETVARVAAGAIAKKWLQTKTQIEVLSFVEQVGNIKANIDVKTIHKSIIEQNVVRCPDVIAATKMIELIKMLQNEGDSVGGIIKTVIRNVPPGLGEPVFDKLQADLAKAMLSINAVKGFEIGSGFAGVDMFGFEHNDQFYVDNRGNKSFQGVKLSQYSTVSTKTNNAGGVLGGISNGEDIYFRVAFKPVSTIKKSQVMLDINLQEHVVEIDGRHDPCVVPRAVAIVDAMAYLVIMDHYLRQQMYVL